MAPARELLPDETDALSGNIRKQSDEDGLVDVQMSAKTAGNIDRFQFVEGESEVFQEHLHGCQDRPFALDQVADVVLGNDHRFTGFRLRRLSQNKFGDFINHPDARMFISDELAALINDLLGHQFGDGIHQAGAANPARPWRFQPSSR